MQLVSRLAAAALLAGTALAGAAAQTPPPASPPAATTPAAPSAPAAPRGLPVVNGTPVTEAEVQAAEAELGEALQSVPEAQRREQLLDYLVTVRLLAAQAREQGLDAAPDARARIAFLTEKFLMEAVLRREIDAMVTPAAVQSFYDERVRSLPAQQEVRARHILVATEEEAKAVIEELKRGRDFGELARERSTDPGSKEQGGDLGFFTRDRMVAEFAEAAFALEPGQFTQAPVRSQFGWHVIRVEEKRQQAPPTLADLEPQIRNFLSRRAQADVIQRLRAGARIERP